MKRDLGKVGAPDCFEEGDQKKSYGEAKGARHKESG